MHRMSSLVVLVVAAAVASGLPQYGPPPRYISTSPPAYGPPPVSHKEEPGKPYNYAYAVKDDYHGVDFGANEESDGALVQGAYNVVLPDGRKQTVTYTADHYKGFEANVAYEGEAQYPAYAPPAPYAPPYEQPPSYGPEGREEVPEGREEVSEATAEE
ncbi:unnamed protein product [Meganyctiphanes norvegica]|uniref:Cuticle protein n=1 Tax=Meganyctiphanes norvegica TaxID=48144 RepID=A0AAV2QP28_MEGNR